VTASSPVISRGQVWATADGTDYVTVRDFAEYTCGWMVAISPGQPHDPDYRELLTEAAFREGYRLAHNAITELRAGWPS